MWQLTGRGDEDVVRLLRTIAVRLARTTGGGVDYWLGLPIWEMLQFVFVVAEQLKEEQEDADQARRR